MSDELLIEIENHVALVTLNRPTLYNALNVSLLEELPTALATLANDAEVGCVVITGAGKAFLLGRRRQRAGGRSQTRQQKF